MSFQDKEKRLPQLIIGYDLKPKYYWLEGNFNNAGKNNVLLLLL